MLHSDWLFFFFFFGKVPVVNSLRVGNRQWRTERVHTVADAVLGQRVSCC
jgi:hypothetical protein